MNAARLSIFFFLAMASTAWAQGQNMDATADLTFFQLIQKGGPVMYPLGLCSLIALALGIERAISLRRSKIIPHGFMAELETAFSASPNNTSKAIIFCERSRTVVGRIFRAGLKSLPRGDAAVEKSIEDTGGREADRMKRSLRGLSVIASLAPLLGLLGTVYGLISAFQETASKHHDKTADLAEGIYEALVSTAAGLTIAIPVLMLYQWLNARADGLVDEIDFLAVEFTDTHLRSQK
ncbi:MAG: biopolymer transport protein ExbB [Verrucomicrobiales bacterium]|jgi:biopolymer transport protein ExbB